MSARERALSKAVGKKRARSGTKGESDYFRIVLRPKEEFSTFRYHDVGEKGHIIRLAGKRSSGSWDTQVWLIGKSDAHIEGDTLVADSEDARRLIESLGSKPKHVVGDVLEAHDRPNVPESKKTNRGAKESQARKYKKGPTSSPDTLNEERVKHTSRRRILPGSWCLK